MRPTTNTSREQTGKQANLAPTWEETHAREGNPIVITMTSATRATIAPICLLALLACVAVDARLRKKDGRCTVYPLGWHQSCPDYWSECGSTESGMSKHHTPYERTLLLFCMMNFDFPIPFWAARRRARAYETGSAKIFEQLWSRLSGGTLGDGAYCPCHVRFYKGCIRWQYLVST